MTYVDDAFDKLRHNLEITTTEQNTAARRHNDIRDYVNAHWQLSDDFLTGSYRRDTKTKRLKDIDIFVVISDNGPQAKYRDAYAGDALNDLQLLLQGKWASAYRDGMAVVVPYGAEDDVMSIEVVPAFSRDGGGYLIPTPDATDWMATNPKTHHKISTDKNTACAGRFVPFVKMIKGINRELGEPVSPSFLLEVMAHSIVTTPFGRYQDEIVLFLANAAERIDESWSDPAGLGCDVNTIMGSADKLLAAQALRQAQLVAERAVDLEDDSLPRAAYDEWKKLFGSRISRP